MARTSKNIEAPEPAVPTTTRGVRPGRYTAHIEGDFVVFVIGMRINKLRKVHKWWGPFTAMPKMLRELESHPEKGMLGSRMSIGGRTITVVQYWRSFEQLEAFARATDDVHMPAWRAFNRTVGNSGDLGIYHETFKVSPGSYETFYANMPEMGLGAAGAHVAIGKGTNTARERVAAGGESPTGTGDVGADV